MCRLIKVCTPQAKEEDTDVLRARGRSWLSCLVGLIKICNQGESTQLKSRTYWSSLEVGAAGLWQQLILKPPSSNSCP